MLIEQIARVCHAANNEYWKTHGDDSIRDWDSLPIELKESAIDSVQFAIENPVGTSEDMHGRWLRFKLNRGWKYGLIKSETDKTHPCLMPFKDLSSFNKKKDELFRAIVLALK